MSMPVIYPAPGEGPALARTLLAMAADPHEIGVTTEGGLGFIVSAEVEQLWLDSLAPPAPDPAPVPLLAPPRRGKPRKTNDVELPEE
jgi:hypothetical protein